MGTTKTNNYLLNALTSMAARDNGGSRGILVEDGYIAESCTSNLVFVTKEKRLITPPFDKILAGTTVRKVLELAPTLVADGILKAVSQEPVPVETARDCV